MAGITESIATASLNDELLHEVSELKKNLKAIILAHNYQLPEIQDVADFVGDSLELAVKASELEGIDFIFFCGVHFMAETAKILNPNCKVVVPDFNAGCPLADMIEPGDVLKLRDSYPGTPIVAYVNTSAMVKAEVDICCTSSNAVKIVNSLSSDQIIFVPDKNLAYFVAQRSEKKIIPWNGFCPTHMRFKVEDVERARKEHPNAVIVVHPECRPEVQQMADYILSTGGIYRLPAEIDSKEFVIGTEVGMIYRLQKTYPERKFYPLNDRAVCPNMKKNTLEKLLIQMKRPENFIEVDPEVASRAKKSIDKMIKLA